MLLIKCCCCLCEHAVAVADAGASVAAVTVAVAVATLGSDTTNTGSDTSGAFVVIICVCSVFVLLLVAVVSVLSGTEAVTLSWAVAWAAADCVWYSGGGGGSVAVVSVIRYSPLDDDMLSLARAFLYSVSLSGAITFPSPSKTYGLFGCSSQRSMKFFRLSFVVSNSFVCQMKKRNKKTTTTTIRLKMKLAMMKATRKIAFK